MVFWMNIHGCQLHPKVAIYVVKQLKNDSFCLGLYVFTYQHVPKLDLQRQLFYGKNHLNLSIFSFNNSNAGQKSAEGRFLSKWVYKFCPSQKLVHLSGYSPLKSHMGVVNFPKMCAKSSSL